MPSAGRHCWLVQQCRKHGWASQPWRPSIQAHWGVDFAGCRPIERHSRRRGRAAPKNPRDPRPFQGPQRAAGEPAAARAPVAAGIRRPRPQGEGRTGQARAAAGRRPRGRLRGCKRWPARPPQRRVDHRRARRRAARRAAGPRLGRAAGREARRPRRPARPRSGRATLSPGRRGRPAQVDAGDGGAAGDCGRAADVFAPPSPRRRGPAAAGRPRRRGTSQRRGGGRPPIGPGRRRHPFRTPAPRRRRRAGPLAQQPRAAAAKRPSWPAPC